MAMGLLESQMLKCNSIATVSRLPELQVKLSLTMRSLPDVVQNPTTKPAFEISDHAIAPKALSRIELGRPGINRREPTFSVCLSSQAECRRFDPDHPLS
ncbi:MAG TPA: hypothetical protein DF699_05955, partial [Phycisphaerales bacterium]|nr:hypothetical protein [Phycisphaerales bacterium]